MFIFKELNTDDRDCVKYINRPKFECNHYFSSLNLKGACFSESFKIPKDIKTILTRKELKQLLDYNQKINKLGYGIKKSGQIYKQGLLLIEEIEPIFKKLESKENEKLFKEIQKEEKEYLYKNYQLNNKDVKAIFKQYYLEYRDRGCVGTIYKNRYELATEEIDTYFPNIPEDTKQYFNYEGFADDLLNKHDYIELDDGRCVYLCY